MAVERPSRPLEPAEIALLEAKAAREYAESDRARAEADAARANAKKATHDAAAARILLDREREKRERELTAFNRHHVYMFKGHVDDSSCNACIAELNHWSRTDPACDIEVQFNSPGGNVFAGMALYDYLQELRRAGHRITTSTRGMAASMGGILLQAGDHRVMGAEAVILIHEISAGAGGKIGEIEDTVKLLKKLDDRVLAIFSGRSKLSKARLRAGWRRTDWWITSDDALKFGLVDEVR